MKKLLIAAITIFIAAFQGAYASNNTIYEIAAQKSPEAVYLNLKSDYKEDVKTVKENDESVYFEIKDAKLSDDYKAETGADLSLVVQQIGSKVRIYVKGDNILSTEANLIAAKGQKPFNWAEAFFGFGLLGIISFVAIRFYSVTIKLVLNNENSVLTPGAAVSEKLYKRNRRPEIVYSKMNKEKSEVVDFHYAKGKKNIKIAI